VKKNSIIESLSTRKLRFGGYATLLIVGALAVVLVINVLVGQIPGKLDLTKNKIYSLSEETGCHGDDRRQAGVGRSNGEDDPRQVRRAQPAREAADHGPGPEPGMDEAI
jgi:hypothetical protein